MPKDQRRHIVQRVPKRGHYDTEVIYPIIDEAMICHVSIVQDGAPVVIPTIHARRGDQILLHGLKGGRLLKYAASGGQICIAMTLLDGLVIARSAFHHSMNYRSAVVFGTGSEITDIDEKMSAMQLFVEVLTPGRWDEMRQPNAKEIKQTSIIAVDIEDASAKIRSGPPVDEDEDYELPIWAGLVPLELRAEEMVDDPVLNKDISQPETLKDFQPATRVTKH